MKLSLLSIVLFSFFLSNFSEARQITVKGKISQKNFQFKSHNCKKSFSAQNMEDLVQYDRQRSISGEDGNLDIVGNISSEVIRIETQCEVKISPHSTLTAEEDLVIFAKDIQFTAKTQLKAIDLYLKTEKEIKITAGTTLLANRLLLQTEDNIELKKPSYLKTKLAILNADKCDIHKNAVFEANQVLGSCFNAAQALVKLNATPTSGDYPLVVSFDASESFGLIDQLVFDFGNGTKYSTSSQEVVYTYETEGTFQANVAAKGLFGTLTSEPISITVDARPNLPPIIGEIKIYGLPATAPVKLGFAPWETTSDPDGYIVQFTYDWGDGSETLTTAEGYAEHEFINAGTFLVKITATDNLGASVNNTVQITINQNKAPVADFDIHYGGEIAPATVGIEAWQKSFDEDGWIEEFEYIFGDGESIRTSEGYVQHTYQNAGTYTVKLRAKDNAGLWSEQVSKDFTVAENLPPVLLDFNLGLQNIYAPAVASIEAWPFVIDPDGYGTAYEYNWGDGTIETTSEGYVEHTYQDPGTYLVLVRVQDDRGMWSNWISKEVTLLQNILPVSKIVLLSQNVYAPTKLKFSGGQSEDPDGEIISYNWTLSDGRSFSGQDIEVDFTQAGQYSISLSVADNGGTGTSTLNFEVYNNNPPVANFALFKTEYKQLEIIPLESLSYDIDENQVLTQVWEMSDGSSYLGTHNFHFFETPGAHWIKLTVLDESGAISEKTIALNIIENEHQRPTAIINVEGLEENSNEIQGSIGVDSYDSTSDDGEITEIKWEMGDGNIYYGKQKVTHTYSSPGTYTIKLTITTEFGLWSFASKEIRVLSTKHPFEIDSSYSLNLIGLNEKSFNPPSIEFEAISNETVFSSVDNFQFIGQNNGEFRDYTDPLQKIASNHIKGQITLQEGKNSLKFNAFDENRNPFVSSEKIIYVGSRTLDVKLVDTSGSPVANTQVMLSLVENNEMKVSATTNINGVASFSNIPPMEVDIKSISQWGGLFTARIGAHSTSVELKEISFGQPTPQEQNNLSFGLAGWYYDPIFTDLVDTADGQKIRVVVPPGNSTVYEKSFVAESERFFSHSIDIQSLPEGSLIEIIAFNETSGELDIKTINRGDYIERALAKVEVSSFGRINDVIRFRVKIKSPADQVSFFQKLFSAYAQAGGFSEVIIGGDDINDEAFKFKIDLMQRISDDNFAELKQISVRNLNVTINERPISITNNIYGTVTSRIVPGSNLQKLQLMEVVFQQGNIERRRNLESLNIIITQSTVNQVFERNLQRVLLDLSADFDEGFPIKTFARITRSYKVGEPKDKIIEGITIPSTSLLVTHNLLNDNQHYDGDLETNQATHYNILSGWKNAAWEQGDFWALPITRDLLNLFASRGVEFKVGDVSNINGGDFQAHDAHTNGKLFDAQTRHFNKDSQKLAKRSLDDLETLLKDDPILQKTFHNVLAKYDEGGEVEADMKNRCILGITMDRFIKNHSKHFNHWHFQLLQGDQIIPELLDRKNYKIQYDHNKLENGDIEITASYPLSDPTRASFKVVNKVKNEEVYGSFYTQPDKGYPHDLFSLHYDGNKTFKITFKEKDIKKISDEYAFVAMAAQTSNSFCSAEEIKLGNIDDCNNDSVKGDLALSTEHGGIVSVDISLPDQIVVGNGARLCGNSSISSNNVSIMGNFILENVTIGSNCSSVAMEDNDFSTPPNSILDSKICNKIFGSTSGTISIKGPGVSISQNSQINGNVIIGGDLNLTASEISGHNNSELKTSLVQNSIIRGFDYISGSTIKDSQITGLEPSSTNNFTSIRISGANISNGSAVKGFGLINGTMNRGFFDGWEGFFRHDGYITLHLFSSGSISSGGIAEQNGWIAGTIRDGGYARFYGTSYHHSGVNWGASIGSGGRANCYSYVQSGTLNKSICHKVYNQSRNPDTMDIDDWKAGLPWPTP